MVSFTRRAHSTSSILLRSISSISCSAFLGFRPCPPSTPIFRSSGVEHGSVDYLLILPRSVIFLRLSSSCLLFFLQPLFSRQDSLPHTHSRSIYLSTVAQGPIFASIMDNQGSSSHSVASDDIDSDSVMPTSTHQGSHTSHPATKATSSVKTKRTRKSTQSDARKSQSGAPRHNRGERMVFELDDVLRKCSPEQFKTCETYDVGGVNILNKKAVDSKVVLDKINRRRETHNRVERRRRDCINQLILELSSLLPKGEDESQASAHRVNVLRSTVAHIQTLTQQNEALKRQYEAFTTNRVSTSMTGPEDATGAARSPLAGPTAPIEQGTQPYGPMAEIPMIVEPSVNVAEAPNSRRLNRQTLPRLQLAPPPFHQHTHHCNSGEDCNSECSASPLSSCSGCSSALWSSSQGPPSGTSSGFGGASPRSPGSLNYGPPSPYSPYGLSPVHTQMPRSPALAPWNTPGPETGGSGQLNTGMNSLSFSEH
ncbi:hypothetical protein B0O80DRAFT_204859 [Mortierella sp. GBAus27b]|nr:hypothetical protein B0O80DRAFT_204859 [Mortierella sp. GBAus27b]